ncbi:MAG: tetratricopeptide repeat protein [Gammaproteobacteria bacterium]
MARIRHRVLAVIACIVVHAPAGAAPPAGDAPRPKIAVGEAVCGRLDSGAMGPFDYRDRNNVTLLNTVNSNHFNSDVQQLVRGQSAVEVLSDLDFILRHFPNHHLALRTMTRYYLEGGKQLRFLSADCYFDRALRGYPDDVTVRQIFSMYLARSGRFPEAIDQLEEAVRLNAGQSMELHYNLGLLYADLKQYDLANQHATIAYGMGHPLPGLRDKLVRAGQWRSQEAFEQGRAPAP